MTNQTAVTEKVRKQSAPAGSKTTSGKGNVCEFIDPPNHLLAKVTHNPAMAEVRQVKKGQFTFDKSRLKKMDAVIQKNQSVCLETLNKEISEIGTLYAEVQQNRLPGRDTLYKRMQHIFGIAKALDHLPVSKITSSLLGYIEKLPEGKPLDGNVLTMHFDALFNRDTLNTKIDMQTKLVLQALDSLVAHALVTASK